LAVCPLKAFGFYFGLAVGADRDFNDSAQVAPPAT
jgi:hypothetical protein